MAPGGCSSQLQAPLSNGSHVRISDAGYRPALLSNSSHLNARNLQVNPSNRQSQGMSHVVDSISAMDDRVSSRNSSISTASTLAPPADHPVIWGDNFLVYFEPREFHKSNLNKIYHYQSSSLTEEEACAILMADLVARGSGQEDIDHLDRAMVLVCARDGMTECADFCSSA